jgi:hypothetical protein
MHPLRHDDDHGDTDSGSSHGRRVPWRSDGAIAGACDVLSRVQWARPCTDGAELGRLGRGGTRQPAGWDQAGMARDQKRLRAHLRQRSTGRSRVLRLHNTRRRIHFLCCRTRTRNIEIEERDTRSLYSYISNLPATHGWELASDSPSRVVRRPRVPREVPGDDRTAVSSQ